MEDNTFINLVEGGDSDDYEFSHQYYYIIAIVIIVIIVYFYYNRANFISIPKPLSTSDLPYTGGADIRFASVDSSSNRESFSNGFKLTPY